MTLDKNIFKAYDVRGVYPNEINEDVVYKIGRAFVEFLGAKKVAIGCDIRKSSPSLVKELIRGIIEGGADVYDLGLATTPMIYFASGKLKVDGAIILTASHNPGKYNGVKLCRAKAIPIGANSGLLDVKKLVLENNFQIIEKQGEIIKKDIKDEYINYLSSFMKLENKKFKIVIDFANAMGILELDLFKKFTNNLEIVTMYDDFNNDFPNHEANPLKLDTLKALQKRVIKEKADIGISYDGDADRVGFIDENGQIIPMDIITGLISKMILEKNPGSTILYDLRSSHAIKEVIEENGGIAHECKVGHALIKRQMRKEKSIFAGELSGHYYFKENYLAEAGSLPVVYLLNLMTETNESISELVKEIQRYYHSGEINNKVKDTQTVIDELKKIYNNGKITELDGIKISFWENKEGARWWFNVRSSNTEPVLRLNLEADNEKLMEERRDEVLRIITK
ncbi:phosphomannomutase/phosphoglucomutase [Candidatus Parcubacteria bacterium]|nr:phosphomannomutase/phosphoglucomutase [Candidatus Parcubacteria bacterium]